MRKIALALLLSAFSVNTWATAALVATWSPESGTVGQKPLAPLTAVSGPNIPLIANNPVFSGTKSFNVYLDKSQPTILGAKQNPYRTEMRGGVNFQFERIYWVGIAFRRTIWDYDTSGESWPIQVHEVPSNWTNWGSGNCVQSANSTAPLFFISSSGTMSFRNLNNTLWTKPVDINVWHTMVIQFKLSKGTSGFIRSWYDGVEQPRYPTTGTRQTHRADSALNSDCTPVGEPTVTFVPPLLAAGVYKWDWKSGLKRTSLTTVRQGFLGTIKIAEDVAGNDDAGGFALVNPIAGNDTTPPVISGNTVTPTSTSLNWAWTTNEAATTKLNHNLAGVQQPVIEDTTLTTNHSITVNGLTPATAYGYTIRSADAAGNIASLAGVASTLATTSQWTNITATSITSTSANICGTANVARTFNVQYSTDLTYSSTAGNGATSSTSQCKVITGLTALTTYNFRLSGADVNGNTAVSEGGTFTTLSSLGTPGVAKTSTGATITWVSTAANIGTGRVGLTSSYGTTVHEATPTTNHSVTFTGLPANTLHHYQVGSLTDNIFTSDSTFTTSVAPPTISGVTYSTTKNTITVNWTTDQASDTAVLWGKGKNIPNTPAYNATLVTSHSITLTSGSSPNDIQPNSIYYIRPKSINATGAVVFYPTPIAVITQTKSGLQSYGFE